MDANKMSFNDLAAVMDAGKIDEEILFGADDQPEPNAGGYNPNVVAFKAPGR